MRAVVDGVRLGRRRVGDEALEPRADAPVVGGELAGLEGRLLAVAEQDVDVLGLAPLDARELLVVEEELEDVGGLRGARELGVERLVGAVRLLHQEVGDAAPAVVGEDALVDDVGLAGADRVGGGEGGALVVALRVGDLEDGEPLRAEALEVGVLVLEPLAKDQLRLLVLDLGPLDLPASVRERERRQVLAGEERRDVGRREVEAVVVKAHSLKSTGQSRRLTRAEEQTLYVWTHGSADQRSRCPRPCPTAPGAARSRRGRLLLHAERTALLLRALDAWRDAYGAQPRRHVSPSRLPGAVADRRAPHSHAGSAPGARDRLWPRLQPAQSRPAELGRRLGRRRSHAAACARRARGRAAAAQPRHRRGGLPPPPVRRRVVRPGLLGRSDLPRGRRLPGGGRGAPRAPSGRSLRDHRAVAASASSRLWASRRETPRR